MRYKRRNRGTWLPTLGTVVSEDDAYLSGFGFQFSVPDTGNGIETFICPITADAPTYQGDSVGNNTTMAEVIGNEYFLDRLVGKIFVEYNPAVNGSGDVVAGPVLIAAGFFVARADDANDQNPIGAATSNEARDNYSPLELDTIREPWIWRRAWVLGTSGNARAAPNSGTSGPQLTAVWPASNALCGSVLDGPHFDQKTKRRVGQDDRLFFAISGAYVPNMGGQGAGAIAASGVYGYLDYRLHGSLRKARQNGRF